jgi:tetratricopeptide (TPR) repeat protein
MAKWARPAFLTFFAFLVGGGLVGVVTWFLTAELGMHRAYWIVPIFGAGGGLVGSLLRGDGRFIPCDTDQRSGLQLGAVADLFIGLGGAASALFLFSGTLQFVPDKPDSYVLIISVSFLAGVFGKRLLDLAGKRLLDLAREQAREEAKKEVRSELAEPAAVAYTTAALELNKVGRHEEAVKLAELAIERDPTYVNAILEKGRALHRLRRTAEALSVIEEALKRWPEGPRLLYNRACYRAVLGHPTEDVLADLRLALGGHPALRRVAKDDADLASVRDLPGFQELVKDN